MAALIAKVGRLELLNVIETLHGPSTQSDLTALANLIISHTTALIDAYNPTSSARVESS